MFSDKAVIMCDVCSKEETTQSEDHLPPNWTVLMSASEAGKQEHFDVCSYPCYLAAYNSLHESEGENDHDSMRDIKSISTVYDHNADSMDVEFTYVGFPDGEESRLESFREGSLMHRYLKQIHDLILYGSI